MIYLVFENNCFRTKNTSSKQAVFDILWTSFIQSFVRSLYLYNLSIYDLSRYLEKFSCLTKNRKSLVKGLNILKGEWKRLIIFKDIFVKLADKENMELINAPNFVVWRKSILRFWIPNCGLCLLNDWVHGTWIASFVLKNKHTELSEPKKMPRRWHRLKKC